MTSILEIVISVIVAASCLALAFVMIGLTYATTIKIKVRKKKYDGFFIIQEGEVVLDLHKDLDEIKRKGYLIVRVVLEDEGDSDSRKNPSLL